MAAESAPNVRVTTHLCDVSSEEAILAFRDEVVEQHETDHIHLLFNNAGLEWRRQPVHRHPRVVGSLLRRVLGRRLLRHPRVPAAADGRREGHIVNTSSVNGFWASIGPERPHTAYSAAKFAVKGFTEALITDLA